MCQSEWHMGLFVFRSEVTFRWQQVICVNKEPTQDVLMVMRLRVGLFSSVMAGSLQCLSMSMKKVAALGLEHAQHQPSGFILAPHLISFPLPDS